MDPGASLYLLEEGAVNSEYRVGLLSVDRSDRSQEVSVQVIYIALLSGKVLAAVPSAVWHKKTAKRILPTGSLTKANAIEVMAVDPEEMTTPMEGRSLRVWVGFLAPHLANAVDFSLMEFDADYVFEDGEVEFLLPLAQSLVEVANEHFAFFSAAEEQEPEEAEREDVMPNGASGDQAIAERLRFVEDLVLRLSESVDQMGGPQQAKGTSSRVTFSPSSSLPPKMRPSSKAAPVSRPGALRKPQPSVPALDPAVVESARQAGLSEEVMAEVSRLMSKNVKAQKVKDVNQALFPDPLSEQEEEEGEDAAACAAPGSAVPAGDPLQLAVVQLADIMKLMTEDKKRKTSSQIENALECSTASSSDPSVVGTGKRSAAARRALRSMLNESPEELYPMIEKLMHEDLTCQTLTPGMTMPPVTARAWVEHRSRIGSYRTLAHSAWGVSGALDCLCRGQVAAARARLGILLLQLDQSACDRGSWQLASELSLENPPPFSVLSQHNPPGEGEPPYSRLLDQRWAEVALAYLKEQDKFVTRRKNLGKSRKEDVETESSASPRKPKAKAKSKASQEGRPNA
eukprot:s1777_g8.t1